MENILSIVTVGIIAVFYSLQNKIVNIKSKKIHSVQQVCNQLYKDGNNKDIKILKYILSKSYCKKIIKSAEQYAKKYSWTTKRHDNYPTTDNVIDKYWKEYKTLKNIIKYKINTEISKLYNIDIKKLGLNEIFIIKYDLHGQRFLKYHEDGSEFSFIIGLNDKYCGGGTQFKHDRKIIKTKIGDCLIFSGQNRHRGRSITKGTRYILAGFLNYGGQDYCENIKN